MYRRERNRPSVDASQPDLFFALASPGTPKSSVPECSSGALRVQPLAEQAAQPSCRSVQPPTAHSDMRGGAAPPTATTVSGSTRSDAARTRHRQQPTRVVAVEDLPSYPPELIAAARRSIKEIATDRVLLTYKEIDAFFGISRATVARRLKDGLVPGIRIRHGRVLEDGPVRRLDRTQVLYLLLAVRAGRS